MDVRYAAATSEKPSNNMAKLSHLYLGKTAIAPLHLGEKPRKHRSRHKVGEEQVVGLQSVECAERAWVM